MRGQITLHCKTAKAMPSSGDSVAVTAVASMLRSVTDLFGTSSIRLNLPFIAFWESETTDNLFNYLNSLKDF
jgi:hypothetical protein